MSIYLVSWAPPTSIAVESYVVRKRKPGGTWTDVPGGATPSAAVRVELGDEGPIEFGIAPVVAGIEAIEEEWTVIPAEARDTSDLREVPDVTGFSLAQQDHNILAQWTAVVHPSLLGYEIRRGEWATGIPMPFVPGPATKALLGVWAPGETVYSIKAVADQGMVSAAAAEATIEIATDEYGVEIVETDESAAGFTGTKSGTEVTGGDTLRPVQFPTNGTDPFTPLATTPWWYPCDKHGTYVTAWHDAGAVVDDRVDIELGVDTIDTGFDGSQPTEDVWPEFDHDGNARSVGARRAGEEIDENDELTRGIDVGIEIDTAQDATPTSDGWRPWVPGAVYRMRQYRLRFTLNVHWPFIYPRIPALVHRRIRLNKKAEGEGEITVAADGVDITFPAGRFTTAPIVTLATDSNYLPQFADLTKDGMTVYLIDTTDGTTKQEGTIHYHALGR